MKKQVTAVCLLAALLLLPVLLSGCGQKSDTVTVYCVSSITTAGSNKLFTYDERGNLLEEYYESEKSEYTKVRTYDADGNLLTEVSYDAKGQQNTALLSYAYDDWGNLIKKEQTDLKGNVTTTSYTYDESGKLLSENNVTKHGAVQPRVKYTYDDRGNQLTKTQFNNLGQQINQYRYTYDKRGNRLSEERLTADKVVYKVLYTYDKNDNMLTQEEEVGGTYRYAWTYDKSGNKLTEQYLIDGALSRSIKYSYDRSGNLLEEAESYANGKIRSTLKITYSPQGRRVSGELITDKHHFLCTYDENGNLYQVDQQGRPIAEVEHIRLEIPREALEKVQEQQRSLLESYTPETLKELYG